MPLQPPPQLTYTDFETAEESIKGWARKEGYSVFRGTVQGLENEIPGIKGYFFEPEVTREAKREAKHTAANVVRCSGGY